MGDELGDVPGRVAEVAREGIPEREVENELAGLRPREQLGPLLSPAEGSVEAVSRNQECEVIERRVLALNELQPRRPEAGVKLVQRSHQVGRRAQPDLEELHPVERSEE